MHPLSSTILECAEEDDYGQFCILDAEEFAVTFQTRRPSSFYKWRRASKKSEQLPLQDKSSVYMFVAGGVLGVMILYVTLTR